MCPFTFTLPLNCPPLHFNLAFHSPETVVSFAFHSSEIYLYFLALRQMQAVVLLYNYYHRRQFPQLEFLGFESFCKSASIAKPALLNYMKFMHNCNGGLADLEKQLSITEKMVMDGCSISAALDASKSAPDMEKWPISKVAVFLINPTKETCLLQFSSVTKGVWSLVEKELGSPGEVVVGGKQLKKHTSAEKKTANGSLDKPCEDELQRLAFSEVEYITGEFSFWLVYFTIRWLS